jgi:adenylate cyclase
MQTQRLSVGVADLNQFEALLARLGAERSIALLDEAVNALGEIIVGQGGQIRKYIGDALLFTFASSAHAVRAARQMAAYRRDADGQNLRFYVSVATGEVLVGAFGHPALRSEDVFGETVNRAFRLLDAARNSEDGVALDDETARG